MQAGPHELGVTFLKKPSLAARDRASALPGALQLLPAPAHPAGGLLDLDHRSLRGEGARRHAEPPPDLRLRAGRPEQDERAARQILDDADAAGLSAAGDRGRPRRPVGVLPRRRAEGGFDAGIEMALSGVLVNPQFLFRVEHDPAGVAPNTPYRVSDLELASRLSFFLWSSIPDDELLERGDRAAGCTSRRCSNEQVRRMLADPRSRSARRQLRGAVAVPAQSRVDHAGHAALPGLRRQPAAGVPAGDGAASSRASCARTAACSTCCARTTRS